MPLKKILQGLDISQSDADLIETVFNLTTPREIETDEARRKRAEELVSLFVAGEHDRDGLVEQLTSRNTASI